MKFLYLIAITLVTTCSLELFSSMKDTVPLIKTLKVTKNEIKVTVNSEFKKRYLRGDFFIRYQDPAIDLTKLDDSIVIMPFVLNVISMIWNSGKKYSVASFDSDLYKSLEIIKKLYIKMYPDLPWSGELIPEKLVHNKGVCNLDQPASIRPKALAFSGGVDSTFSCFAHLDEEVLLINAGGHPDQPIQPRHWWQQRKNELLSFAQTYNRTISFLESNYFTFINWDKLNKLSPAIADWRPGTLEGLSLTGIVAPLLVSKGICEFYIASSYSWSYPYATAANPFVDNNIRFAGIKVIHDGFDFSRYDKVEFIVNLCKSRNLKRPYIKACDRQVLGNCCGNSTKCKKCLSTIMSFLVLNEDHKEYGFNIEREEVIRRAQALLSPTMLSETILRKFKEVQNGLKRKREQNEFIPTDLQWLLSIDFTQKQMSDKNYYIKVNWLTDFHEFLPDNVSLPKKSITL